MKEHSNNYCVIMAGGIGSRFWPFSRADKPKQFLDFFGTGRSLLQMTVDRFRPLVPIENMLVVTNVAYKELILQQVPDMDERQILCEPARRNTAPCIAYALAHISARGEQNANIVVAASDHLILEEEKFRQTIAQAFAFVEQHDAIVTLGMKPTRPETGYGYIQMDQALSLDNGSTSARHRLDIDPIVKGEIVPVNQFREKPNLETAKEYLKSGDYLWNSGIFIWNLQTIRKAFLDFLPEVADIFREGDKFMGTKEEQAWIAENFPKCPNISVDYGIMEKAKEVFVMPSDFGWSDLGTWGSLYELSEKDPKGNVSLHSDALFYESKDNIVTLESGKLAVIQGLEDCIVAEENGVLLICKKAEEQRIKEFVSDAQEKYKGHYN